MSRHYNVPFVMNRGNSIINKETGLIRTPINNGFLDGAEVALISLSIPFSWDNVSDKFNNNTVNLIFNGTTYLVNFGNTSASVRDLSAYVNYIQDLNGLYLVNDLGERVYFISMEVNTYSYSVTLRYDTIPLTLPTGWTNPNTITLSGTTPQLSFNDSDFNLIVGADKNTVYPSVNTASGSLNFPNTPDVRVISSIALSCNIVRNDLQLNQNLYSFLGNAIYGDYERHEPFEKIYYECIGNRYDEIQIRLVDQLGREVTIKDDDINIDLVFKIPKN